MNKVDHPKHYNQIEGTECIDIVKHMDFLTGNCVKYLWRWKDKDGVDDLKKARFYLNVLIKENEIDV